MIIDTISINKIQSSLQRMKRLSRTSYHLANIAFKGHHAGKLSSVYLEAQSAVYPISPRPSWIQMEDGKLSGRRIKSAN